MKPIQNICSKRNKLSKSEEIFRESDSTPAKPRKDKASTAKIEEVFLLRASEAKYNVHRHHLTGASCLHIFSALPVFTSDRFSSQRFQTFDKTNAKHNTYSKWASPRWASDGLRIHRNIIKPMEIHCSSYKPFKNVGKPVVCYTELSHSHGVVGAGWQSSSSRAAAEQQQQQQQQSSIRAAAQKQKNSSRAAA